MTQQSNDYLDSADIESIRAIDNSRLDDLEKESIIADIKADAWRRHTQGTINVAKRLPFSVESLSTTKRTPEGWDEAKARVKAQLEKNRMDAPIEGTRNNPFFAAEQREAAESKRVQDWKQRKELEIEVLKQTRIEKEVASYHAAPTSLERKAVLEGLSPEALERIVKR